jgi:hypothetical protein
MGSPGDMGRLPALPHRRPLVVASSVAGCLAHGSPYVCRWLSQVVVPISSYENFNTIRFIEFKGPFCSRPSG